MFPVKTFLARKAPETQKIYLRSLKKFADHVGCDVDHLHDVYLISPRDKIISDLITFSDSLIPILGQNSQRQMVAAVMSFVSYNEVSIPLQHRKQIVPRKGRPRRDKAFTRLDVKRVYDVMKEPIGRMSLLLLFCTGMRISECCAFKEEDLEKRIIHLQDSYCKGGKGRDLVITPECADYLYNIWLPRKQEYLKSAQNKNIGLRQGLRKAGEKSLEDDRVIPVMKNTLYEILTTGFKNAGFNEETKGYRMYHPHSLRKSFRSIVGSSDVDLAENLMGHEGYLSSNYVRFDDIVTRYDKVAPLLTIGGDDPTLKDKVLRLETELQEQRELVMKLVSGPWEVKKDTKIKFNK